ncbi:MULTISPECIES: DUF4142 domain-containing protein [unclassified Actinomadura]|uniref:DUF4142 domain-containing protein n=1 Tax=unclassified Actinomadura TaxID=2626254 RepID=UPI0011EF4EA3|nr:DUF4142 domain-containing protein [Actinomadura sp. K4S16]
MKNSYGMTEMRWLSRLGRGRALMLLATAVAITAAFVAVMNPIRAPASGAADTGGTVNTKWGPLSASDRRLLVEVRTTALWEMPTGQQAQQHSESARVQKVGETIWTQHLERTDPDVRYVAQQLGVLIPNAPDGAQRNWLRELSGKFGADYDKTFVQRLHTADRKMSQLISKIRAQTKNTLIREFSERVLKVVNTHISLLESTGLAS